MMSSIKVPPLGESIVEATVSRWLKKEGDAVAAGDTLVELETDKITVEVPAVVAGVLSKRLRNEGDVVAVGTELGEIADGAAASSAPTPVAAAPAAPPAPATPGGTPTTPAASVATPAATLAAAATPATPATASPAEVQKVSPAATRLAAETGIEISAVTGTGRGGVISKPDVVDAVAARDQTPPTAAPAATPTAAAPPAAPAPTASTAPAPRPAIASGTRETREKMTTRRKRIAENLLLSQQSTAHLTTFNEIDMTAISALRERLRERVEKDQGVKLSFMPFFAKAACLALKAYPAVNAQIDGDSIVYKHYVNMGIAVAAEGGLVVPSVKDADQKSVVEIGRDIAALAKKARDSKLSMEDLTGGTFTITNGGVFGSLLSTPIINYPQVGILGLHKTQDRPIAINGKVEIRSMMYIALSYDHRMIDGQQAVLFLVRIKELMEDPAAMLVL
ncbi:MAG: 2-oxoglutarate dehydrogenase complex dihydrolipoyllysine-residue succinyltransferase [Gemmatimonadota bacterium]|nr:2-oxoglutarate dehydrogenase complex dihydrolipoyllysine-residue succinyltransferase [Gemmatimonadota bacterium]